MSAVPSSPARRPSLADVLAAHRVIVCVGTGGVGKTTLSAALALAAALQGRRAMVLTIDPARQLARALGLEGLQWEGERVDLTSVVGATGVAPTGTLYAGMLDQKAAWDAFITRHATSPEVRDTLLGNAFYQQLSTAMAGSTEYMAIEELCRLDESGRYDLIVVDTPPAAHALDFLRAPARLERLLDPTVVKWVTRPYRALGKGAFRVVSETARYVVRQLERAAGTRTLREMSAFLVALDALFGDIAERTARSKALLRSPETAFVLVAGPEARVLAQGKTLMASIGRFGVHLRAVVLNRVHPVPRSATGEATLSPALFEELAAEGLEPDVVDWLRATWQEAVDTEHAERARIDAFARAAPAQAAWAEVRELDRSAEALVELREIAREMVASAGSSPRGAWEQRDGEREGP